MYCANNIYCILIAFVPYKSCTRGPSSWRFFSSPAAVYYLLEWGWISYSFLDFLLPVVPLYSHNNQQFRWCFYLVSVWQQYCSATLQNHRLRSTWCEISHDCGNYNHRMIIILQKDFKSDTHISSLFCSVSVWAENGKKTKRTFCFITVFWILWISAIYATIWIVWAVCE